MLWGDTETEQNISLSHVAPVFKSNSSLYELRRGKCHSQEHAYI